MKIYRRIRTWVMAGILILAMVALSLIIWYDVGRHTTGEQWKISAEKQITHNQEALKEPGIPESMKKQLEQDIQVQQYRLDHNMKPMNATMWGNIIESSGLVFLITLFVVIVAGDSLAGEFSTGTIKLLLIRPASRLKILLSKYVAALMYGVLLLVILFVSSVLLNGMIYGFSGWDQPFMKVSDTGVIQETNMFLHIWSTYLLNTVSTIMYVTMAFMISAVFRSSAMAIGISIFAMLAGNTITFALSRYEWSKYLLFANIDLSSHLNNAPFKEGMTMGFSITVLLIYFAIFNLLSWLVFTRRDVAA